MTHYTLNAFYQALADKLGRDLNPNQYDCIARWNKVKEELKRLQDEELELRQEIVKNLFSADRIEGSETVALGNGWKLNAKKPLYYKVASGPEMDALEDLCDQNHLGTICEDVFRWKPELNVAMYKKTVPVVVSLMSNELARVFEKALSAVITITPGTPSLELIAPKRD